MLCHKLLRPSRQIACVAGRWLQRTEYKGMTWCKTLVFRTRCNVAVPVSTFPARNFHCTSTDYKKRNVKRAAVEEEEEESDDEDEDSDEEEEDDGMPKDYSEKKVAVHSARLDSVVKAALSIQRTKADEAFHSGKLMVNGTKAFKKAQELKKGDSVDMIIGPSPDNPNFTVVKRILITGIEATVKGKLALDIKKWNNMVVDDYSSPHISDKE